MAKSVSNPIIQLIRQVVEDQSVRQLSDQQAVQQFRDRGDESAFGTILRRHGPMVFDVCRTVLRNEADAEDAFQATFLIFARKAASIHKSASVGSWLHGVAYHTALKARAISARRRKTEVQVRKMPEPIVEEQASCPDTRSLLDEELYRLPDRHRREPRTERERGEERRR